MTLTPDQLQSLTDFLQIAAVSGLLAGAVQLIKQKFGTDSNTTKLITLAGSVALGLGYWFLKGTHLLGTITQIAGYASLIWAFALKKNSNP